MDSKTSVLQSRVLSYNVLADRYCVPLAAERYPHVPDPQVALSWAVRLPLLRAQILASGCDLLCLQEVTLETAHADFGEMLETAGFRYVVHRDGHQKRSSPIGNLIAYKTDAWSAVEGKQTQRSRTLELDVKHLATGLVVGLIGVHLQAGGSEWAEGARVSQLKRSLAPRKDRATRSAVLAWGDFNTSAPGKVHDALCAAGFAEALPAPEGGGAKTCSVWEVDGKTTTWYSFDHMYSRGTGVECRYEALPSVEGAIPNDRHPSDHLPLVTRVIVKPAV